jgi:hypothetical protein
VQCWIIRPSHEIADTNAAPYNSASISAMVPSPFGQRSQAFYTPQSAGGPAVVDAGVVLSIREIPTIYIPRQYAQIPRHFAQIPN